MKRIIVFIIAILLIFSGCTRETAAPTENDRPVTAESVLPHFTVEEQSDNYVSYKDVRPDELNDYIDGMCEAGFKFEEYAYNSLLYRDDVFLLLNKENKQDAMPVGIEYYIGKPAEGEGALTWREAIRVMDDERLFCLADTTPEGFFEATGAQVFIAPVDRKYILSEAAEGIPLNYGYETRMVIVGEKGGFVDYNIYNFVFGDINGDGKDEIVFITPGPTSGVFTFVINVYSFENGLPVQLAKQTFYSDHGALDLKTDENGVIMMGYASYYEEPRDVRVTMENGEIELDDNAFTVWQTIVDGIIK